MRRPVRLTPAQEHAAESALLHTPAAMAVFEDFEQCVLKFKGHCGSSTNLLKMPVPFAYFHVLKLLLLDARSLRLTQSSESIQRRQSKNSRRFDAYKASSKLRVHVTGNNVPSISK